MLKLNHDVLLKLSESDFIETDIKIVSNDSLTHFMTIKVVDDFLSEIDYSQVSNAIIIFAKQDGKVVQGNLTKTQNGYTYTMGTNEIAVPGIVIACVQLLGSTGERLTTSRFKFNVIGDLLNDSAVESTTEFAILQRLKQELESIDVVSLTNIVNNHLSDIAAHGDALGNVIINSNFLINQRGVSGTVTLAAGAYGHDRWKAGASGCTYTFNTIQNVTTITISAGSLQQIIEGKNLYTGTYTLSWIGTSQGKIGVGVYGNSGVIGSVVGGTDLTIEFGVGTVSKVVFNIGNKSLPFTPKSYAEELILCQRYYEVINALNCYIYCDSTPRSLNFSFKTTKRVAPTCKVYDGTGNENKVIFVTSGYVSEQNKPLYGDVPVSSLSTVTISFVPPAGYINVGFNKLIADAEL